MLIKNMFLDNTFYFKPLEHRMKTTKSFNLIELITVILVILLLISLTIPTFSKLKMSARSTLCKGQMRQLGVLFTSYTTDFDGYLPNDLKTDIKTSTFSNNELYANWNGHLLPYLDSGIKTYNRTSRLRCDGEIYTYDYVYRKNNGTTNPDEPLDGGWIVIKDSTYKGGYNTLKLFICPEVHANTYDVGISNDFNGLKIPRVSQLANWMGFVNMGYGYLGGGTPATYLANDIFFGFDGPSMSPQSSLRLSQINVISKKALLIEGGLGWAKGSNGEPEYLYYRISKGYLGANGIWKTNTGGHVTNYVHDTNESFWVMNCYLNNYFPSYWMSWGAKREIALKFNTAFSGRAMMVEGDYGYSIVSYIDPSTGPFDKFFLANPPGVALLPFDLINEPEFHYLSGDMNVLFGDGSVITKNHGWLSMNRQFIGQLSDE
jgi:prepilin-type processing-associated H-X9-DG protein